MYSVTYPLFGILKFGVRRNVLGLSLVNSFGSLFGCSSVGISLGSSGVGSGSVGTGSSNTGSTFGISYVGRGVAPLPYVPAYKVSTSLPSSLYSSSVLPSFSFAVIIALFALTTL